MVEIRIISWNVNGIKNIHNKTKEGEKATCKLATCDTSIGKLIEEHNPHILCLQEVRSKDAMSILKTSWGHMFPYIYSNEAKTAGYSGTAILSKILPEKVQYDMSDVHEEDEAFYNEGRIIRLTFKEFCLINVYTPNSKPDLSRLEFRHSKWEPAFRDVVSYHQKQTKNKVIVCGDLNVAHNEIDLHSPRTNMNHAGFTSHERLSFGLLLHNCHMIDTFRYFRPNEVKYSWWSNFHQSRAKNKGWRIDYFVISAQMANKVQNVDILTEYKGSDHAPVILDVIA